MNDPESVLISATNKIRVGGMCCVKLIQQSLISGLEGNHRMLHKFYLISLFYI